MSKTKIKFDFKNWKIKIEERSRNRMKFQLKLGSEEAEAFKTFTNSVKPTEISMEDFVRSIFFRGVQSLEKQITEDLVKHMEKNKAEYEASGFTFDEAGNLTGVDEAAASGTIEILE
tara:strand:+ start:542 stop:892 length:351 start_codon:yes stop_codon:yes gene_type:complete